MKKIDLQKHKELSKKLFPSVLMDLTLIVCIFLFALAKDLKLENVLQVSSSFAMCIFIYNLAWIIHAIVIRCVEKSRKKKQEEEVKIENEN